MINIIIISTIILSAVGLFISIQTILETRKKYYQDYIARKRNLTTEKNISNGYLTEKDKKNENQKILKK